MIQVNAYIFFVLGSRLQSIVFARRLPLRTYINDIKTVRGLLDLMLSGAGSVKLEESAVVARTIHDKLLSIERAFTESDAMEVMTSDDAEFLANTIQRLDTALGLELGRAPIFYVTPKGISDVRRLITDGASVYEGYRDRLPQSAIDDTNVAGRSLAFALPTGAGFHIARATEAVMRRQMEVFGCAPIRESQRNWGSYIKALKEKGANEKVLHHLEGIKNLHRNPLIHPEVSLTVPEALTLWALCTGVIQAMVADMESKSSAPSAEIAAMLPTDEPGPGE
ncbi:MAG TPA: hypothetical protein VF173_23410 [Thermoanaerobaculia bacterium]|nr:hypothetical protein [Thermoanaerobaculia bacterium]